MISDDVVATLELATITVWDPPKRLTWRSSLETMSDDVTNAVVEERSVSSTVEEAVAPDTVLPWSPTSSIGGQCAARSTPCSAGRMRAMRCEPGVGGRLLEVYDRHHRRRVGQQLSRPPAAGSMARSAPLAGHRQGRSAL